ncbi:MAG: acyl-CoA dehydrogenase C-terminal domain-containing protein [Proteobacteria bacterium]|nr:acyl-CoA dehydrogenase C-terminal domain-containing protein [Pseudomonadota bacterium]
MSEYRAPLRDMRFAMDEILDYPSHYASLPNGEESSPEMVDAIMDEAAKFAESVIAPLNSVGDEEGCQWNDGKVTTPTGFKDAYQQFVDNGWGGLLQKPEWGGQGLPISLNSIVYEMLSTANHAWSMYASLSWGAISTIEAHASEALQQLYIPNMVAGAWSGTMCLTEANSGSDLGLLKTKASPNEDGTYSISGSKIFISSGDHDFTENIIHIVLARLPDAPEGVRGISLFVVPKVQVNADGSLGEGNNVSCGSIEHKMGINGNATCVINFDGAKGHLIAQPHKGLRAMFTFINESRLGVAQQGHAHIEGSYQTAVAYSRDRLQMRAPVPQNPEKPADPIIVHADVRRMLFAQKVFAEGGRLLNYYCAQLVDIVHANQDAAVVENAETQLALLIPVAKGFLTEASLEATSNGIQVLGGHGYISEWGQEQHYRDARITAIYEGTNGIQGLDLLGRKMLGSGGKVMVPFMQEVLGFCQANSTSVYAQATEKAFNNWVALVGKLGAMAAKDPNEVNAAAYDHLMFAGYTVLAYFWAKSAVVAEQALADGSNETEFYQAKIETARFYFARILPRTDSLAAVMASGSGNLMDLSAEAF